MDANDGATGQPSLLATALVPVSVPSTSNNQEETRQQEDAGQVAVAWDDRDLERAEMMSMMRDKWLDGPRSGQGEADIVAYVEHCLSMEALWKLNDMRANNELTDATLRSTDGAEFPIHRSILSSCSPYFRTLFTTILHRYEKRDVVLPGLSSDLLAALVDYAYTKKTLVNVHNVTALLPVADQFHIMGMLQDCCEFLLEKMNAENVIGIHKFAKAYFCQELGEAARTFIMRSFSDVAASSEELMDLPCDELAKILCSDDLNARHEEQVWEVVLKWINRSPSRRRHHITTLLHTIRLGLMDIQFFVEKVKNHPYVNGEESCRPLVIDTLRFLYDLEIITEKTGEVITPELARPRIPHEVMFAIGGWSGGSPTSAIETYDTRADRWVQVKEIDPTGPRAYHGTAVIGYNIYVIGGFDGIDYFNSCRCFSADTKMWREIAPMNCRRCYVSVAVLDGYIYAMGGYDGHHRQNTCEKYDPVTNQWIMIATMNVQRSDASATTLNGRIYITGGFNGQECMNSAEAYDPENNLWSVLPPMRSRRSGVSCIAYQDQLYVVGGFNGISRLCSGERFNPATNTWSPIPDMYNPRSNFAVEVIDDMIFAVGGFNGVTTIYHVECYDAKTNEWYEATDMNLYRSALSACVVIGLPNLNDYIHQHRDRLMEEKRQKLLALQQQQQAANEQQQDQQQNGQQQQQQQDDDHDAGGGGVGGNILGV